ncbi:hypothetical protein BT69DRAFT_1290979 [Atractiella rhizophila]|nr:hypothetical protein BT69DRAFT_1290979 [Atractiella rhizophila]
MLQNVTVARTTRPSLSEHQGTADLVPWNANEILQSASQGVKEGRLLWYQKIQDQMSRASMPVSIDHLSHRNPFITCFFEINDIA